MNQVLTQSKENRLKKKKGRQILRGTRLTYNASVQIRYENALREPVRVMVTEVSRRVKRLFETETAEKFVKQQKRVAAMDESITEKAKKLMAVLTAKFQMLFNNKAPKLADNMMDDVKKVSKSTLHSSLQQLSGGLSLKTGVVPEGMETVSQALIEENASLIKSIPEEYLGKISNAVMRSITTGEGLADLVPELQKYSAQSERKVHLLSLDQTRKAYNTINKQRMQAVGVKKFEWVHSGGSVHPRKSHQRMSGNIYSFDDLPVINEEQVERGYDAPQKGIPGQAINCGCTMVPIIEFENGESV